MDHVSWWASASPALRAFPLRTARPGRKSVSVDLKDKSSFENVQCRLCKKKEKPQIYWLAKCPVALDEVQLHF